MRTYILNYTVMLLVLFTANASKGSAQEAPAIVTDRPTQSLSASTVPNGMFLWETGTLLEITPLVENWLINNSLFRYGVSNSVELRAYTEFSSATIKTSDEHEVFLRNVQLGLKYRFMNRKVQVAYTGHVIFPNSNTVLSDVLDNQVGASNIISVTHGAFNILTFGYNVGYKHLGTNTDVMLYSFVASTAFNDNLGFFAEVYGDSFEFDDFSLGMDIGFTYLICDNLQADISWADSFNRRYNYYSLGLSWRIGKEKQPSADDPESY
jgi:hypothetical protein